MKQEFLAKSIVVLLLVGVVGISVVGANQQSTSQDQSTVKLYASMPEKGGWSKDVINAKVGVPLHLNMQSTDVVHGFAVGQQGLNDVELYPGIPTATTILFDTPGTYTFYCTRWCGPNHWRMRGTIEVEGEGSTPTPNTARYVNLNIDIDSAHLADNVPSKQTSPQRGEQWASLVPERFLQEETYWKSSPSQFWAELRVEQVLSDLQDDDVWDLVSWIWTRQTTNEAYLAADKIYKQECAACHGETGKGDGVIVKDLMPFSYENMHFGHELMQPPDFSDPAHILSAPPALMEGKILRGGMGTGMPLYGSIYTSEEIDALVNYLYTFILEKP